jgi:hypothetical protein
MKVKTIKPVREYTLTQDEWDVVVALIEAEAALNEDDYTSSVVAGRMHALWDAADDVRIEANEAVAEVEAGWPSRF